MNIPKVFIVILHYNQISDTLECLESLSRISYPNHNIIVIDNGFKNDDIVVMKKRFPMILPFRNEINEGYCRGNNRGIDMALKSGADYVLLLNNDTTVREDFLEPLLQLCEEESKIGICGPLVINYYNNTVQTCGGKLNGLLFSHREFRTRHKNVCKDLNFISGCAMLIRRKVFEEIGFLDEDYFTYCEDLDFCLRAIRKNFLIACVPNAVVYHKIARSSRYLSADYIYYSVRNHLLILKKHSQSSLWPFTLTYFILRCWIGYSLKLLWTMNLDSMPAIFLGTRDFLQGNYGKR